jgi:hypothetical protein
MTRIGNSESESESVLVARLLLVALRLLDSSTQPELVSLLDLVIVISRGFRPLVSAGLRQPEPEDAEAHPPPLSGLLYDLPGPSS